MITIEEYKQILAFNESKAFASPYHEEPVNEFLETLWQKYFPRAGNILDMLVQHLPYAFCDRQQDMISELDEEMSGDQLDELDAELAGFRNFVKESVDNILTFEMNEY